MTIVFILLLAALLAVQIRCTINNMYTYANSAKNGARKVEFTLFKSRVTEGTVGLVNIPLSAFELLEEKALYKSIYYYFKC